MGKKVVVKEQGILKSKSSNFLTHAALGIPVTSDIEVALILALINSLSKLGLSYTSL